MKIREKNEIVFNENHKTYVVVKTEKRLNKGSRKPKRMYSNMLNTNIKISTVNFCISDFILKEPTMHVI